MFTPEQRASLRSDLLKFAAGDRRISGTAITGSVAADREDRWSDIDLAFAVADEVSMPDVLSDWTAHMYDRHDALHHLDVRSGAWIYRVFLLRSTLQVDLAFVPATEFRALAPSFRLVSGQANELAMLCSRRCPQRSSAWLGCMRFMRGAASRDATYGKCAEYMISGVRDHALALACTRHVLPGRAWPGDRSTTSSKSRRNSKDLSCGQWTRLNCRAAPFGGDGRPALTEIRMVDQERLDACRKRYFTCPSSTGNRTFLRDSGFISRCAGRPGFSGGM